MLFLINDQIVEITSPEHHLAKRWRSLGCGDPYAMRARDALDFATRVMNSHANESIAPSEDLAQDLAALIITKTGANAALFPAFGGRINEPRLTILPEAILESLRNRAAEEGAVDTSTVWPLAA